MLKCSVNAGKYSSMEQLDKDNDHNRNIHGIYHKQHRESGVSDFFRHTPQLPNGNMMFCSIGIEGTQFSSTDPYL